MTRDKTGWKFTAKDFVKFYGTVQLMKNRVCLISCADCDLHSESGCGISKVAKVLELVIENVDL